MSPKVLALFGAGKIGRSFIAQVFARNGYEVVFIDIDERVVDALNRERRYRLVTLRADGTREEYWVENVRAINGRDRDELLPFLTRVPLMATSVGASAIPAVCRIVAEAARERRTRGVPPFDLILAENMRGSAEAARRCLVEYGLAPADHPGLIEASIGKTAPNVPADEQARDPLLVYGDSYNTLIVSAHGWRGAPPQFPQLYLASSIQAYADRKLFIHNLAHCAFAYWGYQIAPDRPYIHQMAEHPRLRTQVRALIGVMERALVAEHPNEFTAASIGEYAAGALQRIANPTLRDDVWRVGRDIPRKLGRGDRVIGPMLLAARHGLDLRWHAALYAAALRFHARDERGNYDPVDAQFHDTLRAEGLDHALSAVSKLDPQVPLEQSIIEKIRQAVSDSAASADAASADAAPAASATVSDGAAQHTSHTLTKGGAL